MSESSLEEFAPGIWTVAAPLKIAGSQFGTRMTLLRTGDGEILMIAPTPIDDALEAKIRELGKVAAVIAPNAFHHFYFLDALDRFPDAIPFFAEGVASKIGRTPPNARLLGEEADPLWKADLEQLMIPAAPRLNETVFYHGASRTLIVTDFCFNFNPPPRGWTAVFLRLAGAHGKLAVSRLMHSMFKDRAAVRRVVERMLLWDFDRIIVTHGSNVTGNGKQLFSEATRNL